MLRATFFLILALLAATPAVAQSPTPLGIWLHPNKRIQFEIYSCGDRLCGKLIWFKWPNDKAGLPLVDLLNSDPALRTRPLLGLVVLRNLRRTGDNTWEDGEIYNPDDGVDYQAEMSIKTDGTLRIRAYVLITLLGETSIWTRIR
jgi:uncharacterized protein (DUF2147 family)